MTTPESQVMNDLGDAVKEAYSGKYDMMIDHPPYLLFYL